ncbi:MAG TPA: ferritin-like domain-containing protein [Terriglobales bacterium]
MKANSLRELYLGELRDLYDAEHQITKALPKMISKTSSDELKSALTEHLEVTRQQAERLEQIFQNMGEKAKTEKCRGVEGVIQEGSELLKQTDDEDVRDAAIISAAQKVEHYEIASYGTVRTWASLLGEQEAADLLEQTLNEEKEADEKLNEIAESVNIEAGEGETEKEATPGRRTSKSRRAA